MSEFLKQLLDFVKSEQKVFAILASSSGAAILALSRWPELRAGLPDWAYPSIFLLFICSVAAFLMGVVWDSFRYCWKAHAHPFAQRTIRRKNLKTIRASLRALTVHEVLILSERLAKMERKFFLNPDSREAISLQAKGLIVPGSPRRFLQSGDANFKVAENAWGEILDMPEFHLKNPGALNHAIRRSNNIHELARYLPQSHPTVEEFVASS